MVGTSCCEYVKTCHIWCTSNRSHSCFRFVWSSCSSEYPPFTHVWIFRPFPCQGIFPPSCIFPANSLSETSVSSIPSGKQSISAHWQVSTRHFYNTSNLSCCHPFSFLMTSNLPSLQQILSPLQHLTALKSQLQAHKQCLYVLQLQVPAVLPSVQRQLQFIDNILEESLRDIAIAEYQFCCIVAHNLQRSLELDGRLPRLDAE